MKVKVMGSNPGYLLKSFLLLMSQSGLFLSISLYFFVNNNQFIGYLLLKYILGKFRILTLWIGRRVRYASKETLLHIQPYWHKNDSIFLWIWSMTLQLIIVAHEVRKTTRNLTLIWQIVRYVRRAGSTYINHSFILRGVQMLFGLYFWGSAVKICNSYLLVKVS